MDPLAQALHLPGSDKYQQLRQSQAAGASAQNPGPYAGVTPTLAGANAGYSPGGPGAIQGWKPFQMPSTSDWFQRFASGQGASGFNPTGRGPTQFGGV